MTWKQVAATTLAVVVLGVGAVLQGQQPPAQAGGGAQDAVAALKQSLQQGLAKVRQYEWVETTIISLKGEEKARKQNRCYYGADGKVQKLALDQPAPKEEAKKAAGRGRRGGGRLKEEIVENKKEDVQDYMQRASALIHSYVPPSPERIQAAKDAGRAKVDKAGGSAKLVVADYLQPGDSLTITLDPAASKLLGLAVNSYLDKKEDAVTLDVKMNTLPDGALYAAETTLDAKAKNIRVVIQNSGYKPAAK